VDVIAREAAAQPAPGVPLPPDAVVAPARRVEILPPDGPLVRVPLPRVAQLAFPRPVVLLGERPRLGVAPQVEPGPVDELPRHQQPSVLVPLPAEAVQPAVAVSLLLQQTAVGVEAILGPVLPPAPHRELELQLAALVPLPVADLLAPHEIGGGPLRPAGVGPLGDLGRVGRDARPVRPSVHVPIVTRGA